MYHVGVPGECLCIMLLYQLNASISGVMSGDCY